MEQWRLSTVRADHPGKRREGENTKRETSKVRELSASNALCKCGCLCPSGPCTHLVQVVVIGCLDDDAALRISGGSRFDAQFEVAPNLRGKRKEGSKSRGQPPAGGNAGSEEVSLRTTTVLLSRRHTISCGRSSPFVRYMSLRTRAGSKVER